MPSTPPPHQATVRLALLAVTAAVAGLVACAGPSQTAPPRGSGQAAPPPRLAELREDFDPEPYRDGLLIQPEFGPPVQARSVEQAERRPAEQPATAAAAPVDPGLDVVPPAAAEPDSVDLYRVQVMALSSPEAAATLAEELRGRLAAPVRVQPAGDLFMVRAGESTSPTVAEALRLRIVALARDYADAYVVPERVPVDAPAGPAPAADQPPPEDAPAPVAVELVRTSGWRVLLDQFQSYGESTAFRQSALRRLQRNGIDLAVDIVFAAPWYKVEVGNFRTASQAQELAERVARLGYRNALKVRGEVYVPREDD